MFNAFPIYIYNIFINNIQQVEMPLKLHAKTSKKCDIHKFTFDMVWNVANGDITLPLTYIN